MSKRTWTGRDFLQGFCSNTSPRATYATAVASRLAAPRRAMPRRRRLLPPRRPRLPTSRLGPHACGEARRRPPTRHPASHPLLAPPPARLCLSPAPAGAESEPRGCLTLLITLGSAPASRCPRHATSTWWKNLGRPTLPSKSLSSSSISSSKSSAFSNCAAQKRARTRRGAGLLSARSRRSLFVWPRAAAARPRGSGACGVFASHGRLYV